MAILMKFCFSFALFMVMVNASLWAKDDISIALHVSEGACRLIDQDEDRLITGHENLSGNVRLLNDEDAVTRLKLGTKGNLVFRAQAALKLEVASLKLMLIKGDFIIESFSKWTCLVPQGELIFRPGRHHLIIDTEKLTLETLQGQVATLSTADVVRNSKLGWLMVSTFAGDFSMLKE
jgi:hypothetical protein